MMGALDPRRAKAEALSVCLAGAHKDNGERLLAKYMRTCVPEAARKQTSQKMICPDKKMQWELPRPGCRLQAKSRKLADHASDVVPPRLVSSLGEALHRGHQAVSPAILTVGWENRAQQMLPRISGLPPSLLLRSTRHGNAREMKLAALEQRKRSRARSMPSSRDSRRRT